MIDVVAIRCRRVSEWVRLCSLVKREYTGVFLLAPGKSFINQTVAAQARTGQRSHFPV
jgi:hypothetical protein